MIAFNRGIYEVSLLEDNHYWVLYNTGDYKHRICRFEKHYKDEESIANTVRDMLNTEKQVLNLSV